MAGRNRSYDEAAVLTGAMHAFRRHGYDGASIRDLEAATGLNAGSIYNSFRDKAGLFAAAFAHYNVTVLKRRIESFAPPERGLAGLHDLFMSLLREPDGGTFGCLITNSAVELGQRDSTAKPLIDEGLNMLLATFNARLRSAAEEGVVKAGVVPEAASAYLLALYQGVLVLVRGGVAEQVITDAINVGLTALEKGQ